MCVGVRAHVCLSLCVCVVCKCVHAVSGLCVCPNKVCMFVVRDNLGIHVYEYVYYTCVCACLHLCTVCEYVNVQRHYCMCVRHAGRRMCMYDLCVCAYRLCEHAVHECAY